MKRQTLWLIVAVLALAIVPLFLRQKTGDEEIFAGADGQAEAAIAKIAPGYTPWFKPVFEPPSGEIQCALFALQAALGAGFLGYYFGLRKGRAQGGA
jgi:cobalt/nickel transport protein